MPVQTRRSLLQKRKAEEDGAVRREHCTIDDHCAICQETLHASQVYHLPCGHSFHTHCIEQQLSAGAQWSNLCALCRTDHEDTFAQVPALRAIQNTWVRRVRRRVNVVALDFPDGRHAIGYAVDDQGGEAPPFFLWGSPEGGWNVAMPMEMPAAVAQDNNDEAAAGPANEELAAEPRSPTPDSLPPLIPSDTIDSDDWPLLDSDEEDMLASLIDNDSDVESREIDYPDEEASPPQQTPQQEIQNEYLEVTSDDEEQGIHLYNTYVPYPRGYYRFTGNNQRR